MKGSAGADSPAVATVPARETSAVGNGGAGHGNREDSCKIRGREEEMEAPSGSIALTPSNSDEPKAKRARQQLSLIIQPPVPRYPFVNNFFDVHVFLFDEANQVKSG